MITAQMPQNLSPAKAPGLKSRRPHPSNRNRKRAYFRFQVHSGRARERVRPGLPIPLQPVEERRCVESGYGRRSSHCACALRLHELINQWLKKLISPKGSGAVQRSDQDEPGISADNKCLGSCASC
jgi:hypothetical protein